MKIFHYILEVRNIKDLAEDVNETGCCYDRVAAILVSGGKHILGRKRSIYLSGFIKFIHNVLFLWYF